MTNLSPSWLLLAILVSQTQVCAQETKAPVQIQTTVQTPGGMEKIAPMEQLDASKPLPLMSSPKKERVSGPRPSRPNQKKPVVLCGGYPPARPAEQVEEVKTTPEDELLPWRADCMRRIRRRWSNKDVEHSVCMVKLQAGGSAEWIKVKRTKNQNSRKNAIAVIEAALPLRKAPNELPYTGTLKIEFLDYPNIKLSIEK